MEHRKGYKNYLINGCKVVGRSYDQMSPTIKVGLGFFLAIVIATILWSINHAVAYTGMALGFVAAFKLNKDGLSGDNLKFMEDWEKRVKLEIKDDMTETQVIEIMNKHVSAKLEERMKAAFKDIDEVRLKEFLGDDEKGIRSILVKQGQALAELQANGGKKEDLSIRAQVAEWQTKNKEAISKVRSGQRAELPALEIRAAASPMTPANTISDTISIAAGSVIRMGGEVFDIHRVQPTFWDYINKGRTGLETYPWVNKKVPAASGAAGFIGPGVAKPGVSFTFEVEKSNAKKVAVSLKLATELLDDIDGMTTYVQVELAYQLKTEANSKLMTGVESSTVPAGVQTFSLGFTTSGLSTVNPNNWDCCRAIVAQIRLAFINSPIVIFMNPIDTANMDMEKAVSQGTYMGLNVRQVPGAIIVEDYNIPAGFVQAIAIDCLKTLIYKDFTMSFGWEMDDFTKNLITVIGEMRIHSFHSENDAAAFVYDDLADIKSQIAAA